jgi:DNA-binding HxlR family transcriptional regulator
MVATEVGSTDKIVSTANLRGRAYNSIMATTAAAPRPASSPAVGSCPVDTAIGVISGRWKATILWCLVDGPMRTSELRRAIPGISERMLIQHLHELVSDGIIDRHDAHEVPPRVHYTITDYGRTLAPLIDQLCAWGQAHLARQT